ncbi:hypothetical protein VM1G_09493 [Cytospora mali]|uniref:Uncharacterized protein n=1 Tax=Cytospora mali TaxID=578113 RepID=A0A194WBB5_CYTMA|nr:hypothetical protein VM1G_09493 [Valsa mali]
MCVFIYTLPQLCGHQQFQNVCECAVARGAPDTETNSLTLGEPKFLFDTSKSRSRTPAYYEARFPCKKRKAIRPVPGACAQCLKEEQAVAETGTDKKEVVPLGSSSSSGGSGHSSGSSVGLVPASGSGSSDMTNGSGASTPRSLWKLANPVEIV